MKSGITVWKQAQIICKFNGYDKSKFGNSYWNNASQKPKPRMYSVYFKLSL